MEFSITMISFCILLVVMASSMPTNSKDGDDDQPNISPSSRNDSHTFTSGFAAVTGPDGKIYYVKNVNGKIEQGVLEGPMPEIDLSESLKNVRLPSLPFYIYYQNNNSTVGSYYPTTNTAIRQSVNQYLQNIFNRPFW